MASTCKKIEVLLVGTDVGYCEDLIERVGGDDINLKVVKSIDYAIMQHANLCNSYDLIILVVTVDDGIKVTTDLRGKYHVKSMIVSVTSDEETDEQRNDLMKAGVNECAVMPLTDEMMESVFDTLETGMEDGTFKKHFFKALIINDDYDDDFRVHHEELIGKAGGLVTMSFAPLTSVRLGNFYDLVLVTNATKAKNLRDKGITSMIVGVTPSEEKFTAFLEAGVDHMFSEPLAMDDLLPLINHLNN